MESQDLATASETDGLFARARQGDQEAWRALFEACYPKVRRVIRRKMEHLRGMRSLYDSTDFANDVWKSLAAKSDRFDFPSIGALVAFLTRAAEQKLIDEQRRLHTLKRDIERDRPIAAMQAGDEPLTLASDEPTPSQYAVGEEAGRRLLTGRSREECLVIELRKENYSNEEIAERIGWSVRKVQRFLKHLHDSWHASGAGRF